MYDDTNTEIRSQWHWQEVRRRALQEPRKRGPLPGSDADIHARKAGHKLPKLGERIPTIQEIEQYLVASRARRLPWDPHQLRQRAWEIQKRYMERAEQHNPASPEAPSEPHDGLERTDRPPLEAGPQHGHEGQLEVPIEERLTEDDWERYRAYAEEQRLREAFYAEGHGEAATREEGQGPRATPANGYAEDGRGSQALDLDGEDLSLGSSTSSLSTSKAPGNLSPYDEDRRVGSTEENGRDEAVEADNRPLENVEADSAPCTEVANDEGRDSAACTEVAKTEAFCIEVATSEAWICKHLDGLLVRQSYLDVCAEELPLAESDHHDEVLQRYAAAALFSTWRDRQTGDRILSQAMLAWIWGQPFKRGESGKTVLGVIGSYLPTFDDRTWIRGERCRTIICDGLFARLYRAAQDELSKPLEGKRKRVYLVSGNKYRRGAASQLRNEDRARAMACAEDARSEVCREIHRMMNDRPPNTFKKITKRVPEALKYLEAMEIKLDLRDAKSMSEEEIGAEREKLRDQYHKILRYIECQPQAFYAPSARQATDRIFSHNPSFLQLHRDLRAVLCRDFHEADLIAAHLAILAMLLGCKKVTAFLESGGNLWETLFEELEVPAHLQKIAKLGFKPGTYSTTYGMIASAMQGNVTLALSDELGEDIGRRFRDHWIISELLEKRDEHLARIEQDGGDWDAFGQWVPITPERDAKSVLATVAQSYEQLIMKEILDFEEEEGGTYWRVVGWLHDGCYIHCTRRPETYLKQIKERVDAKCVELGIPTKLDIEK